jgi:integrase
MVRVKKETLRDGTVRWRARGVSAGKWPNGKRRLVTITATTKKACEAEVARVTGQVASGTYTPRWDGTVSEMLDAYLKSATFERAANTALSYSKALLPVRERLGIRRARSITREDVEQLRDWMLAEGRRRGGTPGTGLGPRSVGLTIGRLAAAFVQAIQDNRLSSNPVQYVRLPAVGQREDTTWTEGQLTAFLAAAAADRLAACWLLSALGLRRGELLGLKWSDVDLDAGTLTIARARVLVNAKVIEKSPKSRRSTRVLPLFEPVTGALAALQATQMGELDAAGTAYANSGYVAADELGRPLYPEHYSDEFARLCRETGLPKIRLHDTRGTMNGILERVGLPDSLRACWLGHSVQVNRVSYLPRPKELTAVSDTIGRLFAAAAS